MAEEERCMDLYRVLLWAQGAKCQMPALWLVSTGNYKERTKLHLTRLSESGISGDRSEWVSIWKFVKFRLNEFMLGVRGQQRACWVWTEKWTSTAYCYQVGICNMSWA